MQCNSSSLAVSIEEFLQNNDINTENIDFLIQSEYFLKLTKESGLGAGEINALIQGYLSQCDSKERIQQVNAFTVIDNPQTIAAGEKNLRSYFW